HSQAREAHALILVALAERQHIERLERVQRVGSPASQVDDAVSGADLTRLPVLPREAAAAQHVEDLLVEPVLVGRRGPPAGGELEPAHSDLDATGGFAGVRPTAAEVTELDLAPAAFVQSRDSHGGDSTRPPGDPAR